MAKNTTESINEGKKVSDIEINNEVKVAAAMLADETKVKVSIPKSYSKFIGESLPICINGACIVLPVDGSTNEIPETFADLLREYLNNLTT
jgi:hypothetical protein